MKITVMGASGQIGSKVVALLNDAGQETVAASGGSGADVVTGAACHIVTTRPVFTDGA